MKKPQGLSIIQTISLLVLTVVGILLCLDTGIQFLGRPIKSPFLGSAFIIFGLLGLLGVNVFAGGPLDKKHDTAGKVPFKPEVPKMSEKDRKRFQIIWNNFAAELKQVISGTQHLLLMAVPEEGMIRVEHQGEWFLSFDRPDDSQKFYDYGEKYVGWAMESPEYSFIKAFVFGLDHNRVLYVQIELTKTTDQIPQYSISFHPDWQKPTKLVLGMDIENGKWPPHDTSNFMNEY